MSRGKENVNGVKCFYSYEEISEAIREKIASSIGSATVEIVDESQNHAGHIGSRGYSVSHLRVSVISNHFSGMQRLERQRLLHKILDNELKATHSITFVALSTSEVELDKSL